MKRNIMSRLFAVMLIALLTVGMLNVGASAAGACKTCEKEGLEFKGLTATTEFKKISETECARLYQCNNGHRTFVYNEDGSFKDVAAHVAVTKPTCEKAAVCGNCKSEFGAVGGHIFGKGVVRKPTCFAEGATVYTCTVCDFKMETDKVKPLSHWYDEWSPAGAGLNSAPCKRENCTHTKTTSCVDWNFKLIPAEGEEAESYTVCPVCGALSDGGRLELVESARPTPVTGWTPQGDLVLRQGELANGEKIVSVGFEFDAKLTQCTGICKFTVPAEVLDGYQVMLLNADGSETELEVAADGQTATVALDFANGTASRWTLVRMLHLVPIEAEEAPAEEAPAAETTEAK